MTGAAPSTTVILHVDDVGMCHGANGAYLELFRAGAVDTGAVMVPCPWFAEIAAAARSDRNLDLGVHLTMTSEWDHYRWRALSNVSRASGLVDDDGDLPRNCVRLRANIVPQACEIEMRAQIDRALGAGIDATHLDTHMVRHSSLNYSTPNCGSVATIACPCCCRATSAPISTS